MNDDPAHRELAPLVLLAASVRFVRDDLKGLVGVVALPLLLFFALALVPTLPIMAVLGYGLWRNAVEFVTRLGEPIPIALIGVAVHRALLCGDALGENVRWAPEHRRFAETCLAFYVAVGVVWLSTLGLIWVLFAVLQLIAGPDSLSVYMLYDVWILVPVVASYLGARLALVLPSISVGCPIAIGEAWRRTRSHAWRICGAQLGAVLVAWLVALPIRIVAWRLEPTVHPGAWEPTFALASGTAAALNMVALVVLVLGIQSRVHQLLAPDGAADSDHSLTPEH